MPRKENELDSFSEFPSHDRAKDWGWEIRILTETGLHTIHCKWKDYKRPRELSKREQCPHN